MPPLLDNGSQEPIFVKNIKEYAGLESYYN
jgi:hypothetical protein